MNQINVDENALINVISLGGGVQSTVMTLMADKGMFSVKPDAVIFADTQWESDEVYENIEWLKNEIDAPLYTISVGNIREDLMAYRTIKGHKGRVDAPVFIKKNNKLVPGVQHCTRNYKIDPILQKCRQLVGLEPKQMTPRGKYIALWIGISTDESSRMKQPKRRTSRNFFPLVDWIPMSRKNCLDWFRESYPGRILGKSSCLGCPYRRKQMWVDMYKTNKKYWNDVVEVDEAIRNQDSSGEKVYLTGLGPLKDLPGKLKQEPQLDFLIEECEGYCWV